ncbi:MAG: hypothetical protein ABI806_06160 [Candidatus Solibacter sp.]
MKLRLQGNSVRLRLKRSEVACLRDHGLVEEQVDFGGGEVLTYRLRTTEAPGPVRTEFGQGTIAVLVPSEAARAWADSDEVGVYAQSGAVSIAIEKDFRCLTRTDEEQERDSYPHPGLPCEPRL